MDKSVVYGAKSVEAIKTWHCDSVVI